jgi:hypothetical protein
MQGGSALADILAEHEAEEQAHALENKASESKRMSTSGHENEDKPSGQIVADEVRKEGIVGLGTYWDYLKSAGSKPFILFWAILCVGTQVRSMAWSWSCSPDVTSLAHLAWRDSGWAFSFFIGILP